MISNYAYNLSANACEVLSYDAIISMSEIMSECGHDVTLCVDLRPTDECPDATLQESGSCGGNCSSNPCADANTTCPLTTSSNCTATDTRPLETISLTFQKMVRLQAIRVSCGADVCAFQDVETLSADGQNWTYALGFMVHIHAWLIVSHKSMVK